MRIGRSLPTRTVLLLTLLGVGATPLVAQTGRTWIDPPEEPAAPSPNQAPVQVPAAPPAAVERGQPVTPGQTVQPARPEVPPPEVAQPNAAPPPPVETAKPDPAPAPPSRPATPSIARTPQDPEEEIIAERTEAAKAFAVRYLESWSAPNAEALEDTAEFYAPRVLYHGRTISMKRLFNEKRRFAKRWPERDYRPRQDSMGIVCKPPGDVCTVHAVFDYEASNPKRRRVSQGTGALQLIVHFIGEKPIIVAEHSVLLSQERRRNLALEGASND